MTVVIGFHGESRSAIRELVSISQEGIEDSAASAKLDGCSRKDKTLVLYRGLTYVNRCLN